MKTAIQLDFDGTVTVEDISYLLLDTFVGDAWHTWKEAYASGKTTVGAFNRNVFGMMKADREAMTDLVLTSNRVVIRSGFREFIDYCRDKGYKIIITSNGLRFYIEAILGKLGITGIEIFAAENEFFSGGVNVRYLGPDGDEVEDGFKETCARDLKRRGFDIVFAGNGNSDIHPARLARCVFATEDLLERCREEGLPHYPFMDFTDILRTMKSLELD